MDSSQPLVLTLFIPLALQIVLPLIILAGFAVLRLAMTLFRGLHIKEEHLHTIGKKNDLHLERI